MSLSQNPVDNIHNIKHNISEFVARGDGMNYINKLTEIAEENGGIIETKAAEQQGISRSMLSNLYQKGILFRISRGQYIFQNEMQDELLSISKRSNKVVFSHETALFLHGISDRTPFEHTITIPTGVTPSTIIKEECKIYFIKQEMFELGKTEMKTPAGNLIPVYDLERTICDVIRSRSRIGTETFLAALKAYADSPKKDLNKLDRYAKQLRVAKVLRQYLEVLL